MPEPNLDKYYNMDIAELESKISAIKLKYQKRLLILTHHYQREEVVQFGDIRGDSLMLARKSAESDAEFIVFCGVHFMAESSDILTKPHQFVHLPAPDAGCPMADMVNIDELESAWQDLSTLQCNITPVLYVNSSAETKAFCGRYNGSVCTSANAESIIKWGLERTEKVLFLPDEHLGRNTGNKLGIPKDQMILWDPALPLGGNSQNEIKQAKLILWKGYCHVHTEFSTDNIYKARKRFPDAKIIVHPESCEDVVKLADGNGSTSYIENFVKNAPSDSTIIIGTELNMISRLAKENKDKKIYPLSRSICPNMFKGDLQKLLYTLENLGKANVIRVSEDIRKESLMPLERMLFIQNTSSADKNSSKVSALK